ncbi:Arc family DNA-binding protein [Devosia sp. ZB163]|uniref:Arc family DNA-binding protein n=1 Tax=Devosia sp. ZB163 TaxID=3025938 RepID=UPI0023623F82|nr:Arc family DNA-binding protein [Devosia sp. ZB163]MDC9825649.1 Arc family DNA-binding protein [Devosia sp. ZB163]
MPEHEQPRFNLRLTPELKADLARARKASGRSMNGEILARLSLTFEPDPAAQLAEALRPLLALLDERDRAEVVGHFVSGLAIVSRKKPGRRRRQE